MAVLFLAFCACARAQDAARPAANGEPAQSEMEKWLAATDAQWEAALRRDVTILHNTELGKVKLQYLTAIDAAIAKASSAGDLDGAVRLRSEQKRFGDTNLLPEQDDATDLPVVTQIRAAIRLHLARVEKDTAVRTKALHAKYDQSLAQAQTQLTQSQRLDDALLVKARRETVAATWLTATLGNTGQGKTAVTGTPGAAATVKLAATPKPIFTPNSQLTRRITFKATVDAGDNVVIKDGKLHIEHIDWTKPKDISVNGIKWEPSWQDKKTDDFTKFTTPLAPFAGAQVTTRFTQKRKKDGSVKVIEQPTEANGQKLVLHIQDEGGGASDFEVHITW